MWIKKVFNNNVALVRDQSGREYVVQGKGLAFQHRPGDWLDASIIERRFVPVPSDTTEHFAALVADIPLEHIIIAEEIVSFGRKFLETEIDDRVLVALADHIRVAIQRTMTTLELEYPLEWEVRLLYPHEVSLGENALSFIEKRTGIRLPAIEAIPLALHFVNAQIGAGPMTETVRVTGLIRDIVKIIEDNFSVSFSSNSIDIARFATHLRYLFLAHMQNKAQIASMYSLIQSVKDQDNIAYSCARSIADVLERKMSWKISENETLYIALHVIRLTTAARHQNTQEEL